VCAGSLEPTPEAIVMTRKPERTEAAEYYFQYIDLVPDGDIVRTLLAQRDEAVAYLEDIPDDRAGHRYAEDKWTLRNVVGHLNDTERLFTFRAFWFARGFETPLPSFDQNVAIAAGGFDARTWRSLIDEFAAVRAATIAFFASLPQNAWDRRGIASGNPFTVRALAYLTAGHVTHHMRIVGERYLAASA
jgi:DinB superfamily